MPARELISAISATGSTLVLDAINAGGEVFLSHTRLDGRYVLRLAIGNLHTTERHVARAWELLNSAAAH